MQRLESTDSFITSASHALLEPIQSISGYLELILDGKVPEIDQRNQFLTIAYREAQYLANCLNQLLIASSIEAGKFDLHIAPLSVNDLMERGVKHLTAKAIAKGVFLEATTSDVPYAEGDEKLLTNVLLTILDTLIKFASRAAKLTVSASVEDEMVFLRSTDNSGGITEEILAELYEQRSDSSAASATAGRGFALGLPIAKYIVEAHKGRIWFENSAELESALIFTMPLKFTAPLEANGKELKKGGATPNPKVLIVDDEPEPLQMMEYALNHEGFEIFKASNGLEALEVAKNEQVDLMVLDVMLPGIDGYEVCHRLRSTPKMAYLPVLMISAKSREEDKATALRVGAQIYLKKPFAMSDLVAGVRKLLADAD